MVSQQCAKTKKFNSDSTFIHSNYHRKSSALLTQSSYIQQVLISFCLHFQNNVPLSLVFDSMILLLCFVLVWSGVSLDVELLRGRRGLPASADASTILFTISNTSLIFGRVLAFLTKHRLATWESLLTNRREYFPSSLGSTICRNCFASDKYGFTHANSFCSLLGRFRSIGRLPVMSS